MSVVAPPRPPRLDDEPEALIREARARRRRRRLRTAIAVTALVVAAGATYGLVRGGGTPSVVRVPGGPVVNVRAFAQHGRLAFVSGSTLWVLDGARGTLHRIPRQGGAFTPERPAFSPDGKWLAYLEHRVDPVTQADISRLWIARADGTGGRAVPGPAQLELVGWSPHADLLAVIAGPEHTKGPCPCFSPTTVRLVSPNGATRVLVRGPWIYGAAWSPGGNAVAVGIDGLRTATIATYPVARGRRTVWLHVRARERLNGSNGILVELAGWWAGVGIGFWVFGNGSIHNNDQTPLDVIAAPGATPRTPAQTLSDGTTEVAASDGRGRVALVADTSHGRNGGRVVWDEKRVELCARTCALLPAPASKVTDDPAWAPDGQMLAFVQAPDFVFSGWRQRFMRRWYAKHVLRVYDVRTRSERTIPDAVGATVPAWSPDGKSLLYVAGNGLWLLPSLDAQPVEIARPLFTQRQWPAYYGQIAWTSQFAWSG